jgi:hypothetical protein
MGLLLPSKWLVDVPLIRLFKMGLPPVLSVQKQLQPVAIPLSNP